MIWFFFLLLLLLALAAAVAASPLSALFIKNAGHVVGPPTSPAANDETNMPEGTVDLGSPENWATRMRDTPEGVVSTGIAKTEVPSIAVVETKDGPKAISTVCPHKKKDLTVHGYVDEENGVIRCLHKAYGWCAKTGVSVGARSDDIALYDVAVDENDVARTSEEVLR